MAKPRPRVADHPHTVEGNLGLVGFVLGRKTPSHVFQRIAREDAYQAGVVGLTRHGWEPIPSRLPEWQL